MKKRTFQILVTAVTFLVVGCAPVKPWQKGNFIKRSMAFEPDPLRSKFLNHVYESREAASGGYGISAVGCGCK